jgi:hypothetical protein
MKVTLGIACDGCDIGGCGLDMGGVVGAGDEAGVDDEAGVGIGLALKVPANLNERITARIITTGTKNLVVDIFFISVFYFCYYCCE